MADETGRPQLKVDASTRFNPRPPVMADETCKHRTVRNLGCSFNPRPPVMADETKTEAERRAEIAVSIRVRQ